MLPTSKAGEIPVHLFREILLWPFALDRSAAGWDRSTADIVRETWTCIEDPTLQSPWHRVLDPAEHIPRPVAEAELPRWQANVYAEGQYFHDFISDLLFRPNRKGSDREEDFKLYNRRDITRMTVTWSNKRRSLRIDRLNLYVFRTGAAVLVVEVFAEMRSAPGWTLADVQDFHDRFRRTHVPFTYFGVPGVVDGSPGAVVGQVILHHAKGDLGPWNIDATTHKKLIDAYGTDEARRAPAILPHWIALLGNALPLKGGEADPEKPTWTHIADDRLPTIACVSVTDPRSNSRELGYYHQIRRGDYVRLCFADSSGTDAYPYDPSVLTNFERVHTYDWFHNGGTRFLLSGHAFVAVGAGGFFDTTICEHVRRHYFQMGLLLHIEMAGLLAYSRTISHAAADMQNARQNDGNEEARLDEFDRRMNTLEREYLLFVHRFRFTGVSNQMQGRALFEMWRDRLGLPALADDLEAELRAGTTFLNTERERREAKAAEEQAKAAEEQAAAAGRLSAVAALGVAFGLPMAFLGMDTIGEHRKAAWAKLIGSAIPPADDWLASVATTLAVGGGFLLLAWIGIRHFAAKPRDAVTIKLLGILGWFSAAALVACALAVLHARFATVVLTEGAS